MPGFSTPETVNLIQSSFAGGEISPDVANRVDLEKYQSALLKAKNCYIRPYGAVYRRAGSVYLAKIKAKNDKVLLRTFKGTDHDYMLIFTENTLSVWDGDSQAANLSTPYAGNILSDLRFCQSADIMYICSGLYPIYTLSRYSDTDWRFSELEIKKPYYDDQLLQKENIKIKPSGTAGGINVTSNLSIFASDMVGGYLKLEQNIPTATVQLTGGGVTSALLVGKEWSLRTNQAWSGTVHIDKSLDGNTWKEYRAYVSKKDANYVENGTFTEPVYLRLRVDKSEGDITATLSRLEYTHTGTVKITSYSSPTYVSGNVVEPLGDTSEAVNYSFGVWAPHFGYPRVCGFFQDRFIIGATKSQPYMLWMSRSGDYYNFSVEKTSGSVTDDSAIALSFISREQSKIEHLVTASDLIIFTDGDEWIMNGGNTITPAQAQHQIQTSRGCTNVAPLKIGNRTLFVQRRGITIRDMGYDYTSDSYDGADLTLLAKHLTKNNPVRAAAYMQDPDSRVYCVTNNGEIICLAYVIDQKVFAWSTMETQGKYLSVCNIESGTEDNVYVAVKRAGFTASDEIVIERLVNDSDSDIPEKHIMLDCAKELNRTTLSDFSSDKWHAPYLAGAEKVDVLADNDCIKGVAIDGNGDFSLPSKAQHVIVGLPYVTDIELPNIETSTQEGTLQGRKKKVTSVVLRLSQSLGGYIGLNEEKLDEIKYDEFSDQTVKLYSGDKECTTPNPGFEMYGRIFIRTDEPYPFSLASVVRRVVIAK